MSAISVVGERESSISRRATVGSVGSWGDDQIFCASIIQSVVQAAGGESFLIIFNIDHKCETARRCRPPGAGGFASPFGSGRKPCRRREGGRVERSGRND